MTKKTVLFFLIFSTVSFSQNNFLKKDLFKIDILNPGLSFEKRVSENATIDFKTDLAIGYAIHNDVGKVITSPFIKVQYRNYYNLEKRIAKGKFIDGNSGGYLALNTSYYFNTNDKKYVNILDGFTIGGVWGFQKTYNSGLNLGANAGLGYNFDNNSHANSLVPILNFSIAWVIFK